MKVIDKLGKTDSTTLVIHARKDGKIEVACNLWSDTKVIMPDEVLELRSVNGTARITRARREFAPGLDLPKTIEDALTLNPHVDPIAVELDPVTGYGQGKLSLLVNDGDIDD